MLENRGCPCVFVTVCDSPSKYVLNTLQFAHVETGTTPEERVTVIMATIHQLKALAASISNLICQILSNLPEIMH